MLIENSVIAALVGVLERTVCMAKARQLRPTDREAKQHLKTLEDLLQAIRFYDTADGAPIPVFNSREINELIRRGQS